MNFIEKIMMPLGFLEIIVKNHYTGEILRRDKDHNQIQDWARHALAHLTAGRLFCTWGNHGEEITDIGTYSVPHIEDGNNNPVTSSPWVYGDQYAGLIQTRDFAQGDDNDSPTTDLGAPLYPFFPTKMRFGVGGLDADQNPRVDIEQSVTKLQNVNEDFPFVIMDRARSTSGHIILNESESLNVTHKVTFSVNLPGGEVGYPYDGFVISEAGLFCDAALLVPVGNTDMRTGAMIAYRTFYGITKNESIDVQFNWTFLF